jgi:hypothetical protein
MEEMEKRSDRHIRDLVAHTAFASLSRPDFERPRPLANVARVYSAYGSRT